MRNHNSEVWSDAKKFRVETWRAAIFGALGAVVATIILGTFSDASKSQREFRAKALDEFIRVSHHYTWTLNAYCQGGTFDSSDYEGYRAAARAMSIYFANSTDVSSALTKAYILEEQLRTDCDKQHPLDDAKLKYMRDSFVKAYDNAAQLADERLSRWWKMF